MANSSAPAPAPASPSNVELFPTLTAHGVYGPGEVVVPADLNPRLPVGVVVAILMVVGLVGNGVVLYVYHFKMQRTVFSTFVTVLAALDLATVLVSMPIDVVIKTTLLDRSSAFDAICKVAHFEVYSTSLASGSVLLLIAVTRYTKVCHPMHPGLSKRHARLLCLLIVFVASLLCTVTFVINGMEKVRLAVGERDYVPPGNLTGNGSEGVVVVTTVSSGLGRGRDTSLADLSANVTTQTEVVKIFICRTSEEHKGTVLYYVLQAVLMTAFVSIFFALIVLHCRISTAVMQFERRQSSMRRVSVYSAPGDLQQVPTPITAGMFRIFASITVIFVVSYLPHLICLIVEKSMFSGSGKPMPTGTRVVMDLAYNFPYINVVANPFIYGYRSVEFRRHCVMLLHRFFCCGCSCCRRR